MSKKPQMYPISLHGWHLTLEEFLERVATKRLLDIDGFGRLATATKESDVKVGPSLVRDGYVFPEWATHVVWFNR